MASYTDNTTSNTTFKRSRSAYWSIRFALSGLFLVILVIFLHRLEMMHFSKAMIGFVVSALLGLLAVLASIVGMFTARNEAFSGKSLVWIGRILGLIAASPLIIILYAASKVPPIHDISTNLQNPPKFESVLAVRTDDHNPLDRQNPENLAELQKAAYPSLGSIFINKQLNQVFEQAHALVLARGWEVIGVSKSDGRIEATATSPIMRFKDDVVIRMRSEADRTVVDMRSVSRVGKSDLGANAARIKAFLADLQKKTL